jgi:hypothetical protein
MTIKDDLKKRLIIKAGCIEMCEIIAWGSDSAIMREAAARITKLEVALLAEQRVSANYKDVLKGFARNIDNMLKPIGETK